MSEPIPMLTPNSANVKRVLYKGMQGADVKYVQEILSELNGFYNFCPTKSLQPSGYFGDGTQKFVKFFQYYTDLIPDSHFDKATNDAMERIWSNYIVELSLVAPSKPKKNRGF